MATLKLYLNNAATPYTPDTVRGAWDETAASAVVKKLGATKSGSVAGFAPIGHAEADYDTLLGRFVSEPLSAGMGLTGNVTGVIGVGEYDAAANAQLHLHIFVLQGTSDTLRGTICSDYIDSDECAVVPPYFNDGESFTQAMTALWAHEGDTIVVEVGVRRQAAQQVAFHYGGTNATDLVDGGDSATYPAWVEFDYVETPANPNAPTITSPASSDNWREDESHDLTYTVASPEQSEGLACEYEFELDITGSFTGDETEIVDGVTGGSYSWTIPSPLVASDTATCKIRVRARVVGTTAVSTWSTSGAFTIQPTMPSVSLVTPSDGGLLTGVTPAFIFGTNDDDPADTIHIEFELSTFADYRSPSIDSDSTTDYALWEESSSPFDSWSTLGEVGTTPGYRVRYQVIEPLRYDTYYGRVRVTDGSIVSAYTEFTCTISVDSALALSVTIGGTAFYPTGSCVIVENTGGEPSPITMEINLSQFLAHPLTKGDEIAIASGLGNHNRSWNGTLEGWTFSGTAVTLYGLQDDAYLSRKVVTGDEASADLGTNLKAFVDDFGTPLTGTAIDTTTGTNMALTGGYKLLREHFQDAVKVLPSYLLWVDSGGDIHFVDQDGLDYPTIEIYEEDPS